VRRLVNDSVIKTLPKTGVSSYRKKKIAIQKKKGRRKGIGSRKGRANARAPKKKVWMKRIRAIRRLLVMLKKEEYIDGKTYRSIYLKAKSGFFRNKAHVAIYLERNDMLKKELKKEKYRPKRVKKKIEMKKPKKKKAAPKPVAEPKPIEAKEGKKDDSKKETVEKK